MVEQRIQVTASRVRFRSNPFGQVDPRGELKLRKSKMPVTTMVPYDDVPMFMKMAEEVMQAYKKSQEELKEVAAHPTMANLTKLASRVEHDHLHERHAAGAPRELSEVAPKVGQAASGLRGAGRRRKCRSRS